MQRNGKAQRQVGNQLHKRSLLGTCIDGLVAPHGVLLRRGRSLNVYSEYISGPGVNPRAFFRHAGVSTNRRQQERVAAALPVSVIATPEVPCRPL
jgi:hypothetical protein